MSSKWDTAAKTFNLVVGLISRALATLIPIVIIQSGNASGGVVVLCVLYLFYLWTVSWLFSGVWIIV